MGDSFSVAGDDSSNSDGPSSRRASSGIKDTLESILIALILAFVFRAFVVEAFVIPTGSMATTLLGAHFRMKCQDCGYDFTANFSAPQIPGSDDIAIPSEATGRTFNLTCPNCGFKVPRNLVDNPDQDATAPPVNYGDRILVLKYAYLGRLPDRWDVVVFKSPYDQDIPGRPMTVPDFQQNYIKRLVGLPNEEIMLLDGDVYVRKTGSSSDAIGGWQVQTKPRYVQDALWRVITDNDYQPRGLQRAGQAYGSPWKPVESAPAFRETATRRAFEFDGQAAMRFDPEANPSKYAFTDWSAFNVTEPQQRFQNPNNPRTFDQFDNAEVEANNSVSDLQLKLTYARKSGDGPLRLSMTKLGDTFTAEILPESVRVLRLKPNGSEEMIGSASLKIGTRPVVIAFQNVDYRVSLSIDGKELISSTPGQYAPDVADLVSRFESRRRMPMPAVRIDATGHAGRLSHVSLWRDIYYTNRALPPKPSPRQAIPGEPIRLGPKEYFTIGDNSPLSLDARFWTSPIDLKAAEDLYADEGRVPERFLLGKAFFVYWPAGYPAVQGIKPFVPDFGRMRLIH